MEEILKCFKQGDDMMGYVFWKTSHLTGQTMDFRRPEDSNCWPGKQCWLPELLSGERKRMDFRGTNWQEMIAHQKILGFTCYLHHYLWSQFYHKFTGLKHIHVLSHSFWGSGIQAWLRWVLCLRVTSLPIKMFRAMVSVEAQLGKDLLLHSSRLLEEFILFCP